MRLWMHWTEYIRVLTRKLCERDTVCSIELLCPTCCVTRSNCDAVTQAVVWYTMLRTRVARRSKYDPSVAVSKILE